MTPDQTAPKPPVMYLKKTGIKREFSIDDPTGGTLTGTIKLASRGYMAEFVRQNKQRIETQFPDSPRMDAELLASLVVSWNMVDEGNNPVQITAEAILDLTKPVYNKLLDIALGEVPVSGNGS